MYVVCVTVFVKPEDVNDFIEATKDNASNTHNEPGNVRFDVLQAVDEPSKFFLYEVYKAEEDFKSHQQTQHYLRWRETVADMMAQPRQGVKHYNVFPSDGDW
jgi:autoinducer 2-degrading protein